MKRILSLLVAMIMALGCVGITAMAETVNTPEELLNAFENGDGNITLGSDIDLSGNSNVAKIGDTYYATFDEALTAANAMTGEVTIEIYGKVTLNKSLAGSYNSITFVGKADAAEIYLEVEGYITANGKDVAFEDLTLSKSEGGSITNAGFMNVAFGIYDVKSVSYTDCTFANGAYASSGKNTFTGCTFYRSHDKYGLWAYGDVEAIVEDCTFADYRGIKMYAEGAAKTVDLTVTNTNFTAVTDKPAIVLTYGESVTLEGNTYSSTGVFELDLDGAPNGTPVTSDVPVTCKNDNGACGVLVDGKIYTTVAQAAEVAEEGSTVVLLHDSTETVEFAEGVILDKNGFTAENVTVAKAGLSGSGTQEDPYKIGTSEELFLFASKVNDGTYKGVYAELTADIDLEQEDWTSIGTSSNPFTGTFDGKNFTISNVWSYERGLFGFTGYGNYVDGPKEGRATIKNLTINGVEVYNQTTSAVGGVVGQAGQNTEISGVTVTGYVQVWGYGYVGGIVGQGYVHIDDCHVIGVNSEDGDISEINAAYWAVGGIVGHAGSEGGASITNCSVENVKIYSTYYGAGSIAGVGTDGPIENVSAEKVTIEAQSSPDANGYLVGCNYKEITGNSSVSNMTLTVAGEKCVGADVVAMVGENCYFQFTDALKALKANDTLTLLADVTISEAWDCRNNGAKITVPVTIDGNGKTLKLTGSIKDNNWNTVFRFEDVATVKNLTIDVSEATGVQRGISSKLSITAENCKFIGNGSSSKRAIIFGEGAGDALSNVTATITGCTFTNWSYGVSDNQSGKDAKSVSVTGSNFNNASALVSASEAVTFTGNTVNNGYVNIKSYTADNTCNVTATGNTLDLTKGDDNKIDAGGEITAQDEFYIPAKGSNSLAYTKEVDGYVRVWGQSENTNAAESFVLKLYSEDTLMATTVLNDVNNIIDGSQDSVTWNFFYPESNDDYWTTTWEKGHPNALNKPTKVELYIDGTLVSTTAAQMNGADGVNPVVWEDLGGVRAIELPTATVTEIKNDELTFALNFKADEASEAQLAYYGDWFADYVLTVNKDVTFNANGGADGYLSGQYDAWSENWVNVPFEDVTLKANEPIKIMEYAAYIMGQSGLKLTYNDVYGFVKDFNCGVFFEEEFLAKNPDFEVTLELRMYNPKDESESYTIGEKYKFAASNIAKPVAKIGETTYDSLENALAAAKDGETVTLIWAEGDAPIAMNGAVYGKSVTITGTADVDWSKGFLFVGRGGEGNGTLTFDKANLTSASGQSPTGIGIHVSGREKNTNNKYDGTVIIKDSVIDLDYLINKGTMTLDNSTLTVKHGFSVGGRPASETESGVDATATITLNNNSKVIVNNHNGMGLGYEALGVMNIDATSEFETTQSFLVTEKGTMNIVGTAKIAGTLTNKGTINLKDVNATITAQEGVEVNSTVDGYEVDYTDGKYSLKEIEEVEKFKLVLTNATLGNSLAINFIYAKSDIVGTDYVAKIKHTTATGVEEKEIPYTAWVSNGDYIYIPYDGISAKQMGDVVEITICKTDGTAVSETETESLENYAINYFNYYKNDSSMKLWKQAIADMLNYGAAAQTYFGYNADKLVNVTAADNVAEYASTKVNYAGEYKSGGEGAYATSLNLDNKIELIALFTGVTDDMTAKVEFTNHNGDSYSYEAELKKNGRYHEVIVDKLVIADINQPVKITVYNADGSEYAWIQDSINEYLGYIQNTGEADPLFEMASKFATSAYAAMHAND